MSLHSFSEQPPKPPQLNLQQRLPKPNISFDI
jgi:hypothetical protein